MVDLEGERDLRATGAGRGRHLVVVDLGGCGARRRPSGRSRKTSRRPRCSRWRSCGTPAPRRRACSGRAESAPWGSRSSSGAGSADLHRGGRRLRLSLFDCWPYPSLTTSGANVRSLLSKMLPYHQYVTLRTLDYSVGRERCQGFCSILLLQTPYAVASPSCILINGPKQEKVTACSTTKEPDTGLPEAQRRQLRRGAGDQPGLARMTVRQHLATLERDALVSSREVRRATGRPASRVSA